MTTIHQTSTTSVSCRTPGRKGLTLLELLMVIAIIGVLTTIVVATVGAGRKHAFAAREVASAKSLIAAYLMTPVDNGGRLMLGLNPQAQGVGAARWSESIREYLGGRYQQTLYVNDQMEVYNKLRNDSYRLTLYCTFGMNLDYVGGTVLDTSMFASNAITHPSDAISPADLIVFASANSRVDGDKYGYFIIRSPTTALWPSREATSNPSSSQSADAYGKVAFRHSDKAVVAFLDGHVALMTSNQMRDMRLWSNEARMHNDPNFFPAPLE